MADGSGRTVLVTGGSGFLGGWCLVALLRRGYRVRTTVRNLAREPEVREAVGTQVDPGDRLTVLAADLTADPGWAEGVGGCDYVLHVASPFPPRQPKDPEELIGPARDGTLRVLRAALEADVERVVLTSSVAAIRLPPGEAPRARNEEDWTDPDAPGLTPYLRSKTIAERAAWDLVDERGERQRLAVVNPGAILGPVLSGDRSYSLEVVERMLNGMPGLPKLGFNFVDVRDVVELELAAMTAPEAGGERLIASAEWLWMADVARILRERLGEAAAKVPTRTVPNLAVRALALFDPGLRSVVEDLGVRAEVSSMKARELLGWTTRPIDKTIADTARSLISEGVVDSKRA